MTIGSQIVRNMLPKNVYDEASDEWLLLRYREDRSQGVFAEIVRRYERELFGYLVRFLGRVELAEDAFQATFLQLHLKCEQFEEGRALRPWLYMIATNKAIDLKRRNQRFRVVSIDGSRHADDEAPRLADGLASDGPAPEAALQHSELAARVRRSLDELPEHLRIVVHLVYFQGLKYREAADALEVPVGTIKSRMNSAMAKLTDAWTDVNPSSE